MENVISNNSSNVAYIFFVAVTIKRDAYRPTAWWQGFVKYAVEIGPDAMIYSTSIVNITLDVQLLIAGYTDT
jgi:hypothetical protein